MKSLAGDWEVTSYNGNVNYNNEAFALKKAISPNYYYEIASGGRKLANILTLEELRTLMDADEVLENLWDFPADEYDEALENLDIKQGERLIAVIFYEKGLYETRFFECTKEMVDEFIKKEEMHAN